MKISVGRENLKWVAEVASKVVNLAELKAFMKDSQPKKCIEIESDGVAVKAATDINGNSIAKGLKAEASKFDLSSQCFLRIAKD